MKCAWWAIVGKHAPRPCGGHVAGKRQDVPSCRKHLRGPLPAVAVVADTIRRTLSRCPALNAEDQATLLRLLVEALETPL